MQIPTKIQHGEKVISTVFNKINGIIDYLNASRVRPGTGIMVQESNGGTIVSAVPKSTNVPVLNAGGGSATGIEASVSGGTASLQVAGSSPLIVEPANENIQISGGTNGELRIGASAMTGFPNYSAVSPESVNVTNGTISKVYTYPVWLIGNAAKNTSSDMSGTVHISFGASLSFNLLDIGIGSTTLYGFSVPVCFPIPANTAFIISATTMTSFTGYAFPTV